MASWYVILRPHEQVSISNTVLMSQDFLKVIQGDTFGMRVEVATRTQVHTFTRTSPIASLPLWASGHHIVVRFDGPALREEKEFLGFHFTIFTPEEMVGAITFGVPSQSE